MTDEPESLLARLNRLDREASAASEHEVQMDALVQIEALLTAHIPEIIEAFELLSEEHERDHDLWHEDVRALLAKVSE